MAAKGSLSKEQIAKKILETFEGSFLYNSGKEIRIPWVENGEELQIKVTLTAAKVAVTPEGDSLPKTAVKADPDGFPSSANVGDVASQWSNEAMNAPTQEEKDNVAALCRELGLIK